MRFSLILATVDRVEEVKRLLVSLQAQTHRDFELIVVDQNSDTRLKPVLEPYMKDFSILHFHVPQERGASKARNVGLRHASGNAVTCPDDDCWYPPLLLEKVACFLNEHPKVDGVSGCLASDPVVLEQSPPNPTPSGYFIRTPLQVLQVPGMVGLFLRTPVIEAVGEFDETLGPGAGTPWGSGEDTDYHLRILNEGFVLFTNPDIVVFHPEVEFYYTGGRDLDRSYRYGAGRTRVWKRHRLPLWYFIYEVSRSWGGVVLSLVQGRGYKATWHWGAFRGKLRGWFSS